MKHEFPDLQARYTHLVALLAPDKPRYGSQHGFPTSRTDDGSAHVELIDGKFNYVVTERGVEFDRRIALDESEVLYWLLSSVTAAIASQFELEHRIAGQDSRRQRFAKDVELLGRMDPSWAASKDLEYKQILARYPFRDE
jgi:hypothetical protein